MTLFRFPSRPAAGLVILAFFVSPSLLASTHPNTFGFTGPEIYPIDSQISQLHVADLDGDGLNDLIVVNNSRSKINLLYNQTGKTNVTQLKPTGRREMNELPPDARFRIESIASEKRISSLIVADLNGDGRPEILFQNQATGQLLYWVMNGLSMVSAQSPTPANPGSADWKLVGSN